MLHSVAQQKPATVLKTLKKTDAFRRPERFRQALNVCLADQQGRLGKENSPYPQYEHWLALLAAAASVNSAAIAAEYAGDRQRISEAIDRARLAAITPLQQAYRQQSKEQH